VASIGFTKECAFLREFSEIHFHLGSMADAPPKNARLGVVIPLTQQGEAGAFNVLRLLSELSKEGTPLVSADFGDLTRYSAKAAARFRADQIVEEGIARAHSIATEIYDQHEQVVAVLACGFPFYVPLESDGSGVTPPSILRYIDAQVQSFNRKIVSRETFVSPGHFSIEQLEESGLEAKRNEYDQDKFLKEGFEAPEVGIREGTIEDFVNANALDLETAPWPCHLCTYLQNDANFPDQQVIKDFEKTCLGCQQTALIIRNVAALSNDLDLLVVVDGTKQASDVVNRLKAHIDSKNEWYRYDTDVPRMLEAGPGPTDVFVCDLAHYRRALAELGDDAWQYSTLPVTALWLPVRSHRMKFGPDFCLTHMVVPMRPEDTSRHLTFLELQKDIRRARQMFAGRNHAAIVVDAISRVDFYFEQLMTNAAVRSHVGARLAAWNRPLEDGSDIRLGRTERAF